MTLKQLQVHNPAARGCIRDVALDEHVCTASGEAVCLFAPTSHYCFWDPAGSAAPILHQELHMPRVSTGGEACRCATRIYGIFHTILQGCFIAVLMMLSTLENFSTLPPAVC